MKNEYRFRKVYTKDEIEKIGKKIQLRNISLGESELIVNTALGDYIFIPNGENWGLQVRAMKV